MRSSHGILLAILLGFPTAALAAEVKLESEDDKTIYALGLSVARNLSVFNLNDAELQALEAGISDGVLNKTPKVDLNAYAPKVQDLARARSAQVAEVEKKASEDFLNKAAAEQGAVKTESGLIYTEITPGGGPSPSADSTVKVNYKGTLRDGTVFDSSYGKEPVTFPVKQVIPCWTEGLQKMKVGGKAKLVCPSSTAYGDRPPGGIKPGAVLTFDVELLEIVKADGKSPARAKPPAEE
jgi:FKBP-type peptidyl-prolyl cis-trans isomerase